MAVSLELEPLFPGRPQDGIRAAVLQRRGDSGPCGQGPLIEVLAFESVESDDDSYIQPSGNASWAYFTSQKTKYTLAGMRRRVAYGVVIQVPYVDELENFEEAPKDKWWTTEDVEVRLVCMRQDNTVVSEQSDKGADGDSNDADNGSLDDSSTEGKGNSGEKDEGDFAPVGARAGFVSLLVGVMAAVAVNMI